jgi:PAB-dependent poly(A)-specific ribonuclease subunit 3
LYAPPETFTHGLLANQRTIQQFFIDEDIRKDLTQRLDTLSKRPQQQQPSRNHQQQQQQKLPEKVNQYHTLLQIKSKHKSHLYRATSESDGKFYFLKRFEGFTLLVGPEFLDSLKPWTSSGAAGGLGVLGRHPNIVAFREAFTTKSFHDDSLIFVYEYHPNVVPLGEKYLKVNTTTASASSSVAPNTSGSHGTTQNQQRQIQERLQMAAMQRKSGSAGVSGPGGGRGRLDDAHVLDEATIWSLICQIISALKAIHNAGLAYRNMNTQKILISGGGGNSSNRLGGDYSGRLRLSCCGIPDALFFNHGMINVFQYQQEDLIKFGEVLIALTCRGKSFPDLNTSLAYISQTYSQCTSPVQHLSSIHAHFNLN